MDEQIYTVITFSPVQGFIEKSRKLRDLYGSSYLLSLLSWSICKAAEQLKQDAVVSPALLNIIQGMPNQIILKGDFSEGDIEQIETFFDEVWALVADSCREWIKDNIYQELPGKEEEGKPNWDRNWRLWKKHAWEFFSAQGNSITKAREAINQVKHKRDWTGINWQGESSTLSGADAIAYPGLGKIIDPRKYNYQEETRKIREFYSNLSYVLGESFIDEREQLSIPELIKRLVTNQSIIKKIDLKLRDHPFKLEIPEITKLADDLRPESFKDLNRHENEYWTGWFQGDGDGAGKYFKSLPKDKEESKTKEFSQEMRDWGKQLMEQQGTKMDSKGRMIYAGGDDFLGVLYEEKKQIQPLECLQWFYTFKSEVWHWPTEKKITPSVGFVWAGSQVPQRDILQHCNEAEQSAKKKGRDRIALRILFNSGNHLEWLCPWWLLDEKEFKDFEKEIEQLFGQIPTPKHNLIKSYKSRSNDDNWTHFYRDVALLESRHAFDGEKIIIINEQTGSKPKTVNNPKIDIALSLIEIYFGKEWHNIIANPQNWFNRYDENEIQTFTGILGDPNFFDSESSNNLIDKVVKISNDTYQIRQAFNDWVINLAKVGFRLTEDKK